MIIILIFIYFLFWHSSRVRCQPLCSANGAKGEAGHKCWTWGMVEARAGVCHAEGEALAEAWV